MLLLPSNKMKPLICPKQIQYNNTTSLLVAIHVWRIVGVVFLWGVSQGILHPAFGIPAGVGDILIGVTAIPSEERIWLVQICSYSMECPRHRRFSQCGQSWFDHFFRVWHINNDNFPMGSSTCCGGTSCIDAAWNYSLSSKENRVSHSMIGD
jgi:hypothetical protein